MPLANVAPKGFIIIDILWRVMFFSLEDMVLYIGCMEFCTDVYI